MALEYVLDEPSSFCVHITRTSAGVTVLPEGRRRIEELAENYVVAVRSRESSAQTGSQLYASLLGPVLSKDDKPKLIIVPDGKLLLLPFDSLPDAKGRYLLESHSVCYAPSATVLYLIRTARPTHQPTLPFLGIGDVQYTLQPPVPTTNDRRDSPSASGPADPFDLAGARLQDIPKTRDEVLQASQVFTHGSRLLLGQEATEARFKSEPLADFRIIHIAAHGIASDRFPDRAALVLGSDPKSGEDGLLQAREIRNLSLNADLVTLSACDTGAGRLQGEEGIANLVRAFLFAGAKSVVASLWVASDVYTPILMDHFYRHLAMGEEKADALRKAKLDLLVEFGDQASPLFWAGFVMVGDGITPSLATVRCTLGPRRRRSSLHRAPRD